MSNFSIRVSMKNRQPMFLSPSLSHPSAGVSEAILHPACGLELSPHELFSFGAKLNLKWAQFQARTTGSTRKHTGNWSTHWSGISRFRSKESPALSGWVLQSVAFIVSLQAHEQRLFGWSIEFNELKRKTCQYNSGWRSSAGLVVLRRSTWSTSIARSAARTE